MARLVIEGIENLDGEYSFDGSRWTNRELHLIKKEAGVRAGEVSEAMEAQDTDLVVAIAAIVLMRHGRPNDVINTLWDAESGTIKILEDQNEKAEVGPDGEPLPPPEAPSEQS